MNADRTETEPAFGKMKVGRKRPSRRMINSVAASNLIAPGQSITCSQLLPRVSTAWH
jgi:hypothetical protein